MLNMLWYCIIQRNQSLSWSLSLCISFLLRYSSSSLTLAGCSFESVATGFYNNKNSYIFNKSVELYLSLFHLFLSDQFSLFKQPLLSFLSVFLLFFVGLFCDLQGFDLFYQDFFLLFEFVDWFAYSIRTNNKRGKRLVAYFWRSSFFLFLFFFSFYLTESNSFF